MLRWEKSMHRLAQRYFVVIASVYAATQIVPAVIIHNGWPGIFYAALVLSFLLYITKPIVNLIMLPINLLTLNLAAWLVNIIIVYIWILVDKDIKISSWEFPGAILGPISLTAFNFSILQVTLILAILLTLLETFFNWLIK